MDNGCQKMCTRKTVKAHTFNITQKEWKVNIIIPIKEYVESFEIVDMRLYLQRQQLISMGVFDCCVASLGGSHD